MTIDEQAERYLANSLDYQMAASGVKQMARKSLIALLAAVARDQRAACASAALAVHDPNWREAVHQAVMNTEIPK